MLEMAKSVFITTRAWTKEFCEAVVAIQSLTGVREFFIVGKGVAGPGTWKKSAGLKLETAKDTFVTTGVWTKKICEAVVDTERVTGVCILRCR